MCSELLTVYLNKLQIHSTFSLRCADSFQSACVVRALFETPWLEASLQFRRSLMITVTRAQSTLHLTGGKIYVMSLETFQAVSVFKLWMQEATFIDG